MNTTCRLYEAHEIHRLQTEQKRRFTTGRYDIGSTEFEIGLIWVDEKAQYHVNLMDGSVIIAQFVGPASMKIKCKMLK
jgi:hypothetical protein